MKEMARYAAVLGTICLVASASLAVVNSLTRDKIIAQAQAEEEASLKEVMPAADHFEAVKKDTETLYYRALDKDGSLIGICFKAEAKGYSSTVQTVAGMFKDGTINAIKVVSQNETPGLGTKVTEPSFTDQFKGKKGLEEVQAITGATISSRAVIDSVAKKAEELKGILNAP
ncbi:MAG: RnfABCDGE type electron transport complex subunit G [Candidatus Omnitrophica bacterium]|nr:RnfABCDGE type electron transport complex subunit G [Candidatus Omnitrophota bacterium]